MRQKHVLTALVIFAVIGAADYSQNLAAAWWVDGTQSLANPKPWIDHRLMDQGQLAWDPLIHTVADMGVSAPLYKEMQSQQPEPRAQQDTRSDHKTDSGYGSSNNYAPNAPIQQESYQKRSSGSPTAPYSEAIYGGLPTTPSADPLVKELRGDPSIR